jgi:hypothetical protein
LLGQDWGGLPGDPMSRGVMKAGSMTFLNTLIDKTKGAISDAENARIVAASPGLEQSYEGNKIMLAIAREVARRSQEKASMAETYLKEHGNLAEFEKTWAEHVAANSIFDVDPKTGQYIVGGKPMGGPGAETQPQPAQPQPQPAPNQPAAALPEGVTEDDIAETMRANNMTREQVLEALRKQGGGGGGT